jgi:hypothetical protein
MAMSDPWKPLGIGTTTPTERGQLMTAGTPHRGLGDTIAAITKWFGIEPCGGCQQRREMLNRWLPYRRPGLVPARVPPSAPQIVDLASTWVDSDNRPLRAGALGGIFASGGGRRGPDRPSGPLDWEGARRQRRSTGTNPGTTPGGHAAPTTFACGIDVTDATKSAISLTRTEFGKLTLEKKHEACQALSSLRTGAYAWDIIDLHRQVTNDALNKPFRPACATSGATPACGSSVTVDGSCHFAGSSNYVIFGVMCKLCSQYYQDQLNNASWYELFDKDTYRQGIVQFSKGGMLGLIDLYKKYIPLLKLDSPAGNIDAAKRWSIAGFDGWPGGAATPAADRANCTLTCPHRATGPFKVSWYPFLNAYSR